MFENLRGMRRFWDRALVSLVDKETHAQTAHTGGRAIWGEAMEVGELDERCFLGCCSKLKLKQYDM